MAAPKLKVDSPLYIHISEGSHKIFEKSFVHSPIVIGRSYQCDIPIKDYSWISRQHFQIVSFNGKWVAVDLNSSSGLVYQGKQFSQLELIPGMELRIGPLTIRFNFDNRQIALNKSVPVTASAPPPVQQMAASGLDTIPEAIPAFPEAKVKSEPTLKKKSEPLQIPNRTLSSAYPHPRPVNFRETKKIKLANSWFTKTNEKVRFVKYESGAANLQLQRTSEQAARTMPQRRALEVHITWKNQIYDSRLYFPGETIGVGTGPDDLYAPIFHGSFAIGRFDGHHADFYLGKATSGSFFRNGNQPISLAQLIQTNALPPRGSHFVLSLNASERCEIDLGANLKLTARYTPSPRQLSKATMRPPDQMLKRALGYSGSAHFLFLILALFFAPVQHIPKIKNMSPRVAKLLTQKKVEVPPPPPPVEKPQEPVKAAEKTPPPKKIIEAKRRVPPKKVIVRVNEKLKTINKLPPAPKHAERTVASVQKPPEPNLNEIGALAALGALGTPTVNNPKNIPVAINVNPNAGGQSAPSTAGMIGAVKAQGGKLQAAGMVGIKTKGSGYGTGSGYGVQGLKGMAGLRGVAGGVIGSPKLMEITRDEGLTQKQVMDTVKQHITKIQHCYEKSLLSAPSLAGRVEYEWEINPQGMVKWAKVKRSDVANGEALNNCVTDVFKKMKFPVAKNGLSTTPSIGFPFGRL